MYAAKKRFYAGHRHTQFLRAHNPPGSRPCRAAVPPKRCASLPFRRNGRAQADAAHRYVLHRSLFFEVNGAPPAARGMYRCDENSSVCSNPVPPVSACSVCHTFLNAAGSVGSSHRHIAGSFRSDPLCTPSRQKPMLEQMNRRLTRPPPAPHRSRFPHRPWYSSPHLPRRRMSANTGCRGPTP